MGSYRISSKRGAAFYVLEASVCKTRNHECEFIIMVLYGRCPGGVLLEGVIISKQYGKYWIVIYNRELPS